MNIIAALYDIKGTVSVISIDSPVSSFQDKMAIFSNLQQYS